MTRQQPNGPVSRASRDGGLLPCSSFTGVGRERDEMRETCEGPLGGACGGPLLLAKAWLWCQSQVPLCVRMALACPLFCLRFCRW